MADVLDCEADVVLPAYNEDCYEPNDEGVSEVFLTDQKHPVTGDPSMAASWTSRLSNSSDGTGSGSGNVANPIRHIKFKDGSKPATQPNYKAARMNGVRILQESDHSIVLVDDDDSRYDMWRAYQENGKALMYYRSGKHFYGGKAGAGNGVGIKCTVQPVFDITPGTEIAHKVTVTIIWQAKTDPDRFLAPF